MIHRIGIAVKPGDARAAALAADVASWIDDCGYRVFVAKGGIALPAAQVLPEAELPRQVDAMLVFGGDGTLLGVGRRFVGSGVPILGINLGRLGFLTDTPAGSVRDALADIFSNRYKTVQHCALQVKLCRDDEVLDGGVAMNDVVMLRRDTRPIEFEVHIRTRRAFRLRADGMVVATPAGSTAYALSAGGPIVHPGLQAMALVPICPHTLSNRPLVIPMSDGVDMRLLASSRPAGLDLDGRRMAKLRLGDVVRVREGGRIDLIHLPDHHYFDTLRDKLHWADGVGSMEREC